MPRRAKRERGSAGEATPGLQGLYEGPALLSELLSRAGSTLDAAGVEQRFRAAQAAGEERGDVIPSLFEDEPRFASPDEARRLYQNLFGLWNRLARGLPVEEEESEETASPAPEPEPRPKVSPLPPRGAAPGSVLEPALVEAVWKYLDALPERERRRLRDRFEGAQPDLVAWLDALPLGDVGAVAAADLTFEAWAMFDVAFGERVNAVPFGELRALEAEPPPLESTQPALADYVGEALDLAAEEDATFGAAPRAQVERVLATVAATLAEGLRAEGNA